MPGYSSKLPFFRSPYNYDTFQASDDSARLSLQDDGTYGESLTVQAHAEDADLNVLMRRFGVTGKMPENPRIPEYGDFSEITDFRGALDAVRRAEEGFAELPAHVRGFFKNDPQMLLLAAHDPGMKDKFREFGLLKEVSDGNRTEPSGAGRQGAGGAPGGVGAPAAGGAPANSGQPAGGPGLAGAGAGASA